MQSERNRTLLVAATLIVAAAASRIIPHMPNFSPLNAMALFGAAYLPQRALAFVVPLGATWLSDLFLNNVTYAEPGQQFAWVYPGFYWQYLAYIAIGALGILLFRRGVTPVRVVAGTLGAGWLFFAISNFCVWISGSLYPLTGQGLIACYVAALPFYRGTLAGDVVFTALLFGGFILVQRLLPTLQPARSSH
jgi:hypothetical protein